MKHLLILLMLFIFGNGYAPELKGKLKETRDKSILHSYQKQLIHQRIITIQRAIRFVESSDNYTKIGRCKEYGAYQYLKSTWSIECKRRFGKILNIKDPLNQDFLTYVILTDLVGKGYSNEQIASIWNCGKPEWKGKRGRNKMKVYYDVPNHVKKIMEYLKDNNCLQ